LPPLHGLVHFGLWGTTRTTHTLRCHRAPIQTILPLPGPMFPASTPPMMRRFHLFPPQRWGYMRVHQQNLPCHNMLLILGSCRPHVCSFLESATILRIHRCGSKASFDVSPAVNQPQPVGDPHWTGVTPLAAGMPLVGREPNFNHNHVSGRVGVARRLLANPLYDTSFASCAWRRSRMACARARRESIRSHDVSIFFVPPPT